MSEISDKQWASLKKKAAQNIVDKIKKGETPLNREWTILEDFLAEPGPEDGERKRSDLRMNQTELGELIGVSRPTIFKYSRMNGCPKRDQAGRYNVDEFRAFYEARKPDRAPPASNEARARFEKARARLAEIKVDEAEGRLIDAESVTMEWIEIGTRIRSDLLSQPQKLAPELVRLVRSGGDEAAVCELLTERIRDILLHLASGE